MTNSIPSQETLNGVLIDILKGAKDAGSEIYGASKAGIIKAIDFAQEQAPKVVQEFLEWKFSEALIEASVYFGCLCILLYLIFYLYKKLKFHWDDFDTDFSVLLSLALILCLVGTGLLIVWGLLPNVKQMVKVKVAPRVYLIDWATDQIPTPIPNPKCSHCGK